MGHSAAPSLALAQTVRGGEETAECWPVPLSHRRAMCMQQPDTIQCWAGPGVVYYNFHSGQTTYLLPTSAMAVYSPTGIVFRVFFPLMCFITLLTLYSGMIWNYSYQLPHSNPPIVQRQLSLPLSILTSSGGHRAAGNRVGKPLPRSEPCH